MSRKSNAQIEAEAEARQAEIAEKATAQAMHMFQGVMAEMMSKIAGAPRPEGAASTPDADRNLAESLTHAMLKASATPAKRASLVDPEEQAARDLAKKAMVELLIKLNAEKVMPIYRVTRKTYLAEMVIDPQFRDPATKQVVDQEINWRGVPNQAMTPVVREPRTDMEAKCIKAGEDVHALYRRYLGVPVFSQNAPSLWVTNGKEILRANPSPGLVPVAPMAPGEDPRRLGQSPGAQTVRILGKTADPAVVTP